MFQNYKNIQNVAKRVLDEIEPYIVRGTSEKDLVKRSIELLKEFGITETWYHNAPALILLGSRSCLSVSGKNYQASDEKVGDFNLVTIDLSPMKDDIWGDCARSFAVENGKVVPFPSLPAFKEGIETEVWLHNKMKHFVSPDMRISELFDFGNHLILQKGFENLDFMGNLGHSIETNLDSRRFIDSKCNDRFGDVNLFTFEPHIRKKGTGWGFKLENIYYFGPNEQVQEL